jgi:two-component system cell cycle response regulator CpdR
MKILIAEDETPIVNDYKILLESQGHEVVITRDGEACLQLYTASLLEAPELKKSTRPPFDVVVLDVRMPKIDGVQVAKQIMSKYPKQRIIMATAYGEETVKGLVERLGENVEILQKPFDLDTLAAMVIKSDQKSLPFL